MSSETATDPAGPDGDPGATGRVRADVRDARAIVRTELRVRARSLRSDARRLLATAFLLVVFGVGFPLLAFGAVTDYGASLASGPVPVGPSGVAFTAVAAAGLYLGGASGFGQDRTGAVGPLIRTSVPPTAVSLGRLVSELSLPVVGAAPTALVLLAEVGIGARNPITPLLLAAGALPVFLATVAIGRVGGDALRYANRILNVSMWTKAVLFVVVSVAAYVGTQVLLQSHLDPEGGLESFAIPAFLPGKPFQAYASAVLDPLGAAGHPFGVLVGVALLASIPLFLAVALRIETRLLLGESKGPESAAAGSRGVPWPFTVTPSARVAWRYLLRARRDPRMLAHLGPLLFGAMGMIASVFTDPRSLLALGPAAAVIGGACLAGAAFCLNPLGDDVDQLPLLLTSSPSAGPLLRGRALAGMVPGLVLAIGLGAPGAAYAQSVPMAVGQSLLAVVLAAAGAGTALGAGALIPKFERREYMNVERSHPSMIAVMSFFFGGLFVGAIGMLLVHWTITDAGLPLAAIAWAAYLAVLALFGGGGYVYAVRKFDDFTLDEV